MIIRAFKICSDDQYLKTELQHLKQVFHNENGYPTWFIDKTIKEVTAQFSKTNQPENKEDKIADERKEKEKRKSILESTI